MTDKPLKIRSVRVGDKLVADDGFTCLKNGATRTVKRAKEYKGSAGSYLSCDAGRHYLDGQTHSDGVTLVGLSRFKPKKSQPND